MRATTWGVAMVGGTARGTGTGWAKGGGGVGVVGAVRRAQVGTGLGQQRGVRGGADWVGADWVGAVA